METSLVIDDEKDLVMIIKDILETNGYNVLTAYNGFDGIKMSKKKPDLIILDVMMPDIDGFNVCNLIRDNIDCPILFLSFTSTFNPFKSISIFLKCRKWVSSFSIFLFSRLKWALTLETSSFKLKGFVI